MATSTPASGCSPTDLVVEGYDASTPNAPQYVVAPGASVDVPVAVSLGRGPVNLDACKNVSFPLTYFGTAQESA